MTIQDTRYRTDLPSRLDRLAWSPFHTMLIFALGIGWIIDGLEVTLIGALSGVLKLPQTLGLSELQVSLAGSAYVAGAVLGAIYFGSLADRLGRKKLFFLTLGVYASATVLSGLVSNYWLFLATRFLTGAGIGGEYAAINSAIQEFMPARLRGRIDLGVNGSYWIGAAIGALGATALLDTGFVPVEYGWRLAFVVGGALGFAIMALRRFVPESPRWLMVNGRMDEAEAVVRRIEAQAAVRPGAPPVRELLLSRRPQPGFFALFEVFTRRYPRRTVLGLVLMVAQAFLYNAIFFTYGLILARYYAVDEARIGLFLLPFAAGNVAGPLLLGPLFDTWGRRRMITLTYAVSGFLIILTGWLFLQGVFTAATQTVAWSVVFFFASAAASSAYLTVSESFPLEIRARAIAWFYAVGTALGGITGPLVFGLLIGTGGRAEMFGGYVLGGGLMLVAAAVAWKLAVDAENRMLEDVAAPLAADPGPQ